LPNGQHGQMVIQSRISVGHDPVIAAEQTTATIADLTSIT
jgi:hypothetical protein